MKNIVSVGLLAGLALTSVAALADTPGRHPAYLRARTDLWRAVRLTEVRD